MARAARALTVSCGNGRAENIDASLAPEIAAIMAEHHRLNFERRPEHLQWWRTGERVRGSPYGPGEAAERMAAFDALLGRLKAIEPRVPPSRRDAFFELVGYPVEAAAMANARLFAAEAHDRLRDRDLPAALVQARSAHAADRRIAALTARYDDSGGRQMARADVGRARRRPMEIVPRAAAGAARDPRRAASNTRRCPRRSPRGASSSKPKH